MKRKVLGHPRWLRRRPDWDAMRGVLPSMPAEFATTPETNGNSPSVNYNALPESHQWHCSSGGSPPAVEPDRARLGLYQRDGIDAGMTQQDEPSIQESHHLLPERALGASCRGTAG